MQIEFTAPRDRAYARRLIAATSRRGRLVTAVFGVGMTVSGGMAAASGHPGAALASAVPLGLGICWLLKPLILPRQTAARLPDTWFQSRSYVITEDELAWTSASVRTALRWDLVAGVRRHPVAFVLSQGGPLPGWDIPRAALTPEQERELTAFLVRRGLLRATGGESGSAAADAVRPAEAAGNEAAEGVGTIRSSTP